MSTWVTYMTAWVGLGLRAWGLGLGSASWVSGRSGLELGKRARSVVACVSGID